MAVNRIGAFSSAFELFTTDANPNAVITPIRIGSLAVEQLAGACTVWQCTALPSTWVDITAAGGASGWLHVGTVERLTTLTDTVAIGTAAMLGAEKLRVAGLDAVNNGLTDELVVEHQVSGVAAPGLSVGIKFVGETSINVPMDFGRISSTASNVTTGAEEAGLDFWVRTGGAALSAKWALTGIGNWKVNADNAYDIGDKTSRLRNVISNQFQAYANSADVNAIAQLTTAGLGLGPGGGVVMDWFLARSAAVGTARSDMATGNQLGAWGAGSGFAVRAVNTDVNPTLLAASGSVGYGAGGAGALDVYLRRTGAGQLQIDNGAGAPVAGGLSILGPTTTRGRTLNNQFRLAAGGAYNVSTEDDFVGMDTTTGVQAVNLPSVTTVPEGHRIIVKNTAAAAVVNACNVTPNGAETIDAVAAAKALTGTQQVQLISQNSAGVTGWFIIS